MGKVKLKNETKTKRTYASNRKKSNSGCDRKIAIISMIFTIAILRYILL